MGFTKTNGLYLICANSPLTCDNSEGWGHTHSGLTYSKSLYNTFTDLENGDVEGLRFTNGNNYPYIIGVLNDNNQDNNKDFRYLYLQHPTTKEIILGIDSQNCVKYPSGNYYIYRFCEPYAWNGVNNFNILLSNTDYLNQNTCDGIDLSDDYIRPSTLRFYLDVEGKSITNESLNESILVEFSEDEENTYKDVFLSKNYGAITSLKIRQPNNQINGNGIITVKAKKLSIVETTANVMQSLIGCATDTTPYKIACIADLMGIVIDLVDLDVVGTAQIENCSRFANVTPIENILQSEYIQSGDNVLFKNYYLPFLRFEVSAGFEELTDEDWCCENLDTNEKSLVGGGYKYIITEPTEPDEPIEPPTEPNEPSDYDSCLCENLSQIKDKLKMINDSLQEIKLAIQQNHIELQPQITVQPCNPSISLSTTGIEDKLQQLVWKNNSNDGIINAIDLLRSVLDSSLSCEGNQLACILKQSLQLPAEKGENGKSITEVINEKELNASSSDVNVTVTPSDNVSITRSMYSERFYDDSDSNGVIKS